MKINGKKIWTFMLRGLAYEIYAFLLGMIAVAFGLGAGLLIANGGSLNTLAGLGIMMITIPIFWVANGYVITMLGKWF